MVDYEKYQFEQPGWEEYVERERARLRRYDGTSLEAWATEQLGVLGRLLEARAIYEERKREKALEDAHREIQLYAVNKPCDLDSM